MAEFKLDLAVRVSGCDLKDSDFNSLFKRGLKVLGTDLDGGEIHLVLVDDEEITHLNNVYRGINKATDVISLSYLDEDSFPEHNLIGEIMISIETAARQAKEHKKTLKAEVQFLFVHGLLHIFGHDHEKAAEKKRMFDLQDEILGTKSWRKIID